MHLQRWPYLCGFLSPVSRSDHRGEPRTRPTFLLASVCQSPSAVPQPTGPHPRWRRQLQEFVFPRPTARASSPPKSTLRSAENRWRACSRSVHRPCCVATEVFFANDAGLWAFDLLSRFVCPRPNGPFGIPPQSGESVRKPGWRLGLDERLAKIVQGHFDSLLIISSGV